MQSAFAETGHRPWPPPRGPWVLAQRWEHLLFAHWRVPAGPLRSLVPPALDLDTFAGEAWLAVTPFRATGTRARFLPPVPWLSTFLEVNVRTYVTLDRRPGVFFLSLDTDSRLTVAGARLVYHLPYFTAAMSLGARGEWLDYRSRRTHTVGPRAELHLEYRGADRRPLPAPPGTLEHFLVERYCLYAVAPDGSLHRAEIHHPAWRVRPAEARLHANTLARAAGLALPDGPPHLLLAEPQPTVVWPPSRVRAGRP